MRNLLKLEQLFLFFLALFLFSALDYAWWLYALFFLAPDLSIIAYRAGPKIGAWAYNIAHHQAIAIGLYLIGVYLAQPALQFIGLVMLGHSSLDRVFGYGLKYPDSFRHTHLGMIGHDKKPEPTQAG